MNVSIVGATGYTGIELIKILSKHPEVTLKYCTTRQEKPLPLETYTGALPKNSHLKLTTFDFVEVAKHSDVVFLALPHTEAVTFGQKFHKKGKIVIDLSADFRLKDPALYQEWYHFKHSQKALLKHAVYGLPEYYREAIAQANLIANPGCYPTSVILGLAPLLEKKMIEPEGIISDSKSGVSGAGRKLVEATQFCEVAEDFKAYKVSGHQHTPEMEQVLSEVAGRKIALTFVPHLLPIKRGILSTLYVKLKRKMSTKQLVQVFKERYAEEPFVRVLPEGQFPSLAKVAYTNFCDIGVWVDPKKSQAVILSAIDNLLKGASGQAVQNMNIRLGCAEDLGLI
jgi:N-acetyl-gamma-glutamyl-phosphate reductase